MREYAEVGEWGEEIDLLLACLKAGRLPVSAPERAELNALLHAMDLPDALLGEMPEAEG